LTNKDEIKFTPVTGEYEIKFTPVTGEYELSTIRADVEYLGNRCLKKSKIPHAHSLDIDVWQFPGIDPMSFVFETPEDQEAAYAFSRYWVGRTRLY
jgi:hypothetical protein